MKYVYVVLAATFFIAGFFAYDNSAMSFLLGVSLWLGCSISVGLALRADTKEWEKKFQAELDVGNKAEEGNVSD